MDICGGINLWLAKQGQEKEAGDEVVKALNFNFHLLKQNHENNVFSKMTLSYSNAINVYPVINFHLASIHCVGLADSIIIIIY